MADEVKKEECQICAMIERFNNYNTDPDVGQVCPSCPPEEEVLYDELYKKLRQVKGLDPKDAAVIANLKDKELREDLVKMILHVDDETTEMTKRGERIEWTKGNNTLRSAIARENEIMERARAFREREGLPPMPRSSNTEVKDCGEQADQANTQLGGVELNYNWSFIADSSKPIPLLPGHSWGQAFAVDSNYKVIPDFPYLTYDPRARSFGLNRNCPTCSGALGLSSGILEDSTIFEGRKK